VEGECVGGIPIYDLQDLSENRWHKFADVAILCGGSKNDLPTFGPYTATCIDTVDSFDTHGLIGETIDSEIGLPKNGYFQSMNLAAKTTGHVFLVCQGWDPGLFSIMRGLFRSCLGEGIWIYAYYGLQEHGVLSMGHSDAIRQVEGVLDAWQYTHA
jgi:diaminopimelate dehydrogenase